MSETNDSESIIVETLITQDDLLRVYRATQLKMWSPVWWGLVFLVLIFINSNISTMLVWSVHTPTKTPWIFDQGLICFSLFCLWMFSLLIWPPSIKTIYKTSKFVNQSTTYEFSAKNGLKTLNKDTESINQWSVFYKFIETKKDFIFYFDKQNYFFVPKRFFKSEKDIHKLQGLIKLVS